MTPAEAAIREALATAGMFQWPSVTPADLTALLSELDKLRGACGTAAPRRRPECWDFAMDFLGGPENTEVEVYVKALETELDSLRARCEAAEAEAARGKELERRIRAFLSVDSGAQRSLGDFARALEAAVSDIAAHLKGAGRE